MGILLNQYCLISPLEYMSHPLVSTIELLGIDAIQLTHPLGKIAFLRLQKQMVMIAHQAISINFPMKAVTGRPK